jgi:tetratricopeptide (TPR) repeat protein
MQGHDAHNGEVMVVVALRLVLLAVLALGSPEDHEQAALHLNRGNGAFRAGRADEAIREYTTAYGLVPSTGLLFNLGQAYEEADRLAEALARFRQYVGEVEAAGAPDDGTRRRLAAARERVDALARQLEPAAGAIASRSLVRALPVDPAPPAAVLAARPVPPPPGADHTRRIAPKWWVAAAAALVAGTVTTVYLFTRPKTAPDSCSPERAGLGCI